MKIKTILCSALAVSLLAAGCESEEHESQTELQSQAKITKADAQSTALAQVPGGTIKESELEKEKGKLIWSFDIAMSGTKDIKEVNVDAIDGKVVSVETETPGQQAKEKDEDAKGKDKD